jgi:hypothetical protein
LTGADLRPEFVEMGFELFLDKDRLKSTFVFGDFFAPETMGLKEQSFDVILASAFFHLFDWEGQVKGFEKAAKLLKNKPGSMIVGGQLGALKAGHFQHASVKTGRAFAHDRESLATLVGKVAETTGVKLELVSFEGRGGWGYHPEMDVFGFCAVVR